MENVCFRCHICAAAFEDLTFKNIFHMIQKEFGRLKFHNILIHIKNFIFKLSCTKQVQCINSFTIYILYYIIIYIYIIYIYILCNVCHMSDREVHLFNITKRIQLHIISYTQSLQLRR